VRRAYDPGAGPTAAPAGNRAGRRRGLAQRIPQEAVTRHVRSDCAELREMRSQEELGIEKRLAAVPQAARTETRATLLASVDADDENALGEKGAAETSK